MNKVRWLSVVLGLGTYVVLAVVGHLLGHLYARNSIGRGRDWIWFEVFVGRSLNPYPGGLLGDLRMRWAFAWLLGLGVALVVLAVVLALTARAGQGMGALTGAWLGSVLATALAGALSALVLFSGFLDEGDSFALQWAPQLHAAVLHGLYWGAAAGWLVGLAAAFGAIGRSRRLPVDSPPPPER